MPLLLPPTPTSPVSLQQAGALFMQAHQGDEAKPVDASTFVQLAQNGGGASTAFNFPSSSSSSNPFVLAQKSGRGGVDTVGNMELVGCTMILKIETRSLQTLTSIILVFV